MVQLPTVQKAVAALVSSQPLVAVFVGGTSGIGQNTVRELARTHGTEGPGLRIYLVGRNRKTAEDTIAICRQHCPQGNFIFVQSKDLALLKDVDDMCSEITRLETETARREKSAKAHVDMLYISTMQVRSGREETKEGIDRTMSLGYYARMRTVVNLLPLLLESSMPAHVVSIFGSGLETAFHTDDLSLRDPKNSGFFNLRANCLLMTTFFGESIVNQHPGKLVFCHINPGPVMTTLFQGGHVPWWIRLVMRLMYPLMLLISTPPSENGQRMLYLSTSHYPAKGIAEADAAIGTDGSVGSGAYAVQPKNEPTSPKKMEKWYSGLRAEGVAKQVYEHTMAAFSDAEADRRFTG